ncbi:MAG: hypothetical protein KN64_01460 [Sulfurovum sp. AS07-7]|nr:MAG: hypothetical protein KN64_01460 [Sulfurovum sp. AS07-7]
MDKIETILVVDDTPLNIEILLELLSQKYDDILVATDGKTALEIAFSEKIDMILLDIMMPDMDGFTVCQRLKENDKTKDIPVIFITAKTDEDSIERAYDIGGVDYITKPFRAKEVLSRIATHLAIFGQNKLLEKMVAEKTEELHKLNDELIHTQKEIIFTIGAIAEKRSKETGQHVSRVAEYSKVLAICYGLSIEEEMMIRRASPMHDIGKIAIPDNILNKPAKLTYEEFEIMKKHSEYGYEMLKHSDRPLLKMAAQIAYTHHEKWDGSGYPNGLKGEGIPLCGRITALADVFDALGSDRVYKKAMDDESIFKIIREGRGTHFDPKLVDIFFENIDKFLEIRENMRDLF